MKRLLIIMFFGFVIPVACKKSLAETPNSVAKDITGKWEYSKTFYSEGGPLIYKFTAYLNQWVIFNSNNSFLSNMPAFKYFNKYEILDSVKVKFTSMLQPERSFFYRIDSLQNSLSLSPADFICIEGCGDIFQK